MRDPVAITRKSYSSSCAIRQVDPLSALVDPDDLADDERDAPVEERALRALEPLGPLPPIAMYMNPGW